MDDIVGGTEGEHGSAPLGDGEVSAGSKPVKRQRGRPKKIPSGTEGVDGEGAGGVIAEIGSTGESGDSGGSGGSSGSAGSAKRGRKPSKKTSKPDRVISLGIVLTLLHNSAAGMSGIPALRLNQQECSLLSEAMVDCADAWGFNPVTDPRIMSSAILVGVAVMIYGPKIGTVKATIEAKKHADRSTEGQ